MKHDLPDPLAPVEEPPLSLSPQVVFWAAFLALICLALGWFFR